jgi:hypothetical protein
MATNKNVTITMSVSMHRAFVAFEQFNRQLRGTGANLTANATASALLSSQATMSLQKVGMQAIQTAAAFAGFNSVLGGLQTLAGVLRKELEATKSYQVRSAERGVEFQTVMRRITMALPRLDPSVMGEMTPDAIEKMILEAKTPDKVRTALNVETAISTGLGNMVVDRVRNAIMLGEIRPELTQDAILAATRAAQLGMLGAPEGTTAQQLISLGAAALSASPISDPERFYKNIASQTVPQLMAMGATPQFAFGLPAGIGTRAGDALGEMTRTNTLILAAQVLEEARRLGVGGDLQSMFEAVRGDDATRRRVLCVFDETVQTQDNINKAMLKELGKPEARGRAPFIIPRTEYLQAGGVETETKRLVDASMRMIPSLETAGEFLEKSLAASRERTADIPFQVNLAIKRFREGALLDVPPGVQLAGQLQNLLKESGELRFTSTLEAEFRSVLETVRQRRTTDLEGAFQDISAFIDTVERRIAERPQMEATLGEAFGGVVKRADREPRPLTEYEQFQLRQLERLQTEMAEIAQNIAAALERQQQEPQRVIIAGDESRRTPAEPVQAPAAGLEATP